MKKIVNYLYILVLLLFAYGCKDIIIEDISKKEITVISPADNLQTTKNNQLFWWNTVDYATKYNIQIVRPSFAAPDSIFLDTFIVKDRFYYSLDTGKYQWRIRAENDGYKTNYQTYKLRIKE